MPIRKRKPTSAGRRFQTVSDFAEVTRDKPEKALTKPKPRAFSASSQAWYPCDRSLARHT